MIRKISFLFLVFASLISNATCKDKQVVAYRYETDVNGKVIADEWSEGEKFASKWHFLYASGSEVIVDGKRLPIVARNGPCLIVASPGEAPLGAGIWVYAINVKLRSIVASQVNAHIGFGTGIKTRSVCFDCNFQIHE